MAKVWPQLDPVAYELRELSGRAAMSPGQLTPVHGDTLLSAARHIALLIEERDDFELFILSRGFRRCDIPACNCGSFHGGQAADRLREIREALEAADMMPNGATILGAVRALIGVSRTPGS